MRKYLFQDLYDLENQHWWHRAKRKLVLESLKSTGRKNLRILDMGCGTGQNLEFFSQLGAIWGIDNSRTAINFCFKRGLKKAKLGSLYKTGFKSSYFDIIMMLDVLEHVDEDRSLNEAFRLLKPGGQLAITVPAYNYLWSRWDVVLHHKRRYNQASLTTALLRNKFQIVKISYTYSFLVLPVLITRFMKSIIYKNDYPSDFKLSNGIINQFLYSVAGWERAIIQKISLPFGTSLICIATKK